MIQLYIFFFIYFPLSFIVGNYQILPRIQPTKSTYLWCCELPLCPSRSLPFITASHGSQHIVLTICYQVPIFCTAVEPINNVVRVSGEQRRDSATHIHVSILSQIPLPSRLPHNTEQNSMCCTVGPYWLSILNTAVCSCAYFNSLDNPEVGVMITTILQ